LQMDNTNKFEIRKIVKIGNSYCVTIPKQFLCAMHLICNDRIVLNFTKGRLEITKLEVVKKWEN
jgi:antitoxin component of MazEF toxin-antitoxin module